MGLFDLFEDAKENMENAKKAREYIRQAKEYIEDGNRIYNNAYNKVESYANETKYRLQEHQRYKCSIAKELSNNISPIINDFKQFNIDSKIIKEFNIELNNKNNISINDINSGISLFTNNSIFGNTINIPSLSDLFISDEDYYEARRQRDEAKFFKQQMRYERERLYGYKEKMSIIRDFIRDEKYELDTLVNKVKSLSKQIEEAMKKRTFTSEEAKYLKGINAITEQITNMISSNFLSENFNISSKYQQAYEEIKNINANISSSPSINDDSLCKYIISIIKK